MQIMKQAVAILSLISGNGNYFEKTLYGITCLPLRLCNDYTAACLNMSGRYTPGAQVFIMHFHITCNKVRSNDPTYPMRLSSWRMKKFANAIIFIYSCR